MQIQPLRLLLLLLAFQDVPTAACQANDSLGDCETRIREALGYESRSRFPHGLEVEGRGESLGLETRFHCLLLSDGRFRLDVESKLPSVVGFDGQSGWAVDYSGISTPMECADLEVNQLIAWVWGGYWLDPDCPLVLSLSRAPTDELAPILSAKLPDGIIEFDLLLDLQSFRPQRLEWRIYEHADSMELADYERVDGILFPHHIRITRDGQVEEIFVTRVSAATSEAQEACRELVQEPRDTLFDLDLPASVALERSEYGQFLVNPSLDGNDEAWFILDTCSSRNVIDRDYARELGLRRIGSGSSVGVGGVVEVGYCQGRSFSLGPLAVSNPIFLDIDLDPSSDLPSYDEAGILGFDLFARCLAELDCRESTLSLLAIGAWDEREAPWVRIAFNDLIPTIPCTLSGDIQGVFALDTAADAGLILHRRFVEEHGLLEGRELRKIALGGIGGEVPGHLGRIEWVEICGSRIEGPEVIFVDSDEGGYGDRRMDGIIGWEVLSQFKLLIDYPGRRIGFVAH